MKNKLKFFKALMIDVFLGIYLVLSVDGLLNDRHDMERGIHWKAVALLAFIGIFVGMVMFFLKRLSIGRACLRLAPNDGSSWRERPYKVLALLFFSLTFYIGLKVTQFSFSEFFSESGIEGARRIFKALITPNFEILDQGVLSIIETIFMAFIATFLALPFAFILSFFSARNLMKKTKWHMSIYYLNRTLQNISRSIEPLVWAIIFSVWVGIGPFSGMLALFVHSVASLAKLYSEQIENINEGPVEAILSTGAHPVQVVWFGVVPQVLIPFLSFTVYRWDINVRMATIIGLVGGGGIGTLLMQYQGLGRWNEVGLLIMLIAIIVWTMDFISSKVRDSIR